MRGVAKSWKSVVPRVRGRVGADRLSVKRKTREGMMVSGSRRWAGWRGLFVGVVPSVCGVAVAALVACVAVVVFGGGSRASASAELPFLSYFGGQGSASGEFVTPRGVAVDGSTGGSKGDVYVSDQSNSRVEKFDAIGDFVLMFGREVNETKTSEFNEPGDPHGVQEYEKNICTAASGNVCKAGVAGEGGNGQMKNPLGLAVSPVSGSVYEQDFTNHRVQKFGPEGHFQLMFGGDVNKTAVEESATRSSEEDVCPAPGHPSDVCQAGITVSSGEAGEGKFHAWGIGAVVAVGASGTVYVGDENRVQEFNEQGVYQKQVELPGAGKLTALAVNDSGDLFVKASATTGVREYEPTGASSATELHEYDASSTHVEAVATDPTSDGPLYVVEQEPKAHVIEYATSGGYGVVAESNSSLLGKSTGMAVTSGGTVYAANSENSSTADNVAMLGAAPSSGLTAPTVTPLGLSQDGTTSVQTQALINPHFATGTTYHVEYGASASYGERAPAVGGLPLQGGTTNSAQTAGAVLEKLTPDTEYHYRFVAESAAGTTYGQDETFVTYGIGYAGLPDGRVYEQVTPADKYAHSMVSDGFVQGDAAADGEALLFASGAMGEADAGYEQLPVVSRHGAGSGWSTAVASTRPLSGIELGGINEAFGSADLEKIAFGSAQTVFSPEEPPAKPLTGIGDEHSVGIYETLGVSTGAPLWLGKPVGENAIPQPGHVSGGPYRLTGVSPDLSTAYFLYSGTLVPEDAARAPYVGAGEGESSSAPWGFYEWSAGHGLVSAGVLPDGLVSQWGAVPADIAGDGTNQRAPGIGEGGEPVNEGSDVVGEGSDALFVSPDPRASSVTDAVGCGESPPCTGEPPQLYLRLPAVGGGKRSVLVSRSQMPGEVGDSAPKGALAVDDAALVYRSETKTERTGGVGDIGYGYASSDGSRVFFQSDSQLTSSAPANETVAKEYVFDVATNEVQYVPGVVGPIVAASADGSRVLFENTATTPAELDLWDAETGGVTRVAQLPAPEPYMVNVEGRATADGSVFVFDTNASIPAGFNNGGGYSEVYRYETATESLVCVSCAPNGVAPTGNADISHDNKGSLSGAMTLGADTRAMSADGSRIFFDSPTPLVPGATNGKRDVYEWENGKVYLLSSGVSSKDAFYIDSSESGDDVFFATTANLSGSDVDEAYDVYDARVPRPGEAVAASVPCEGAACHGGQASSPSSLSAPPSATFTGLGNLSPAPPASETKTVVKTKAKAKVKKKRKKKKKKSHGRKASVRRRAHGSSHGAGKGRGK